jgi:hypothetical protein
MKLLKPTITYIYKLLSVGHCIVCWSLYCLLVTVLSVGHCLVCWALYCLLVIVLSVGHCIVCWSLWLHVTYHLFHGFPS